MGAYGLSTYIWNNRLKSILLLAGFPFLLLLIAFGFALVISAFDNPGIGDGFRNAVALLPSLVPVALGGAAIWFVIAWFAHQKIIDAVTGARQVDRAAEPRLWNLLETLCISRGITMPTLRIVESEQRNAFASGLREKHYSVTVTRGLMDTLDDAELEAVLAHELTHIRNRDVQLLVISAVFVGVVTLVGDLLVRSPRLLFYGSMRGGRRSGSFGRGRGNGGKGGGGAVVLILVAVAIFILARFLAIALRFALSRKREFLADAGAVELTKNADAMIGALRKIEGRSEIEAPSQVQEMFLDHPRAAGLAGLFATHPSIDDRVAALVRYAGGRDLPVRPQIRDERPDNQAAALQSPRPPLPGPWGGGPWG
jgi:heat shock protein HtpX